MAEIGSATRAPGAMMASPLGCIRTASANIASGLKPYRQSTIRAIRVAPARRRQAFDDLHPGRRLHAAEHDIDDHQHADDHDRVQIV